MFLQDKKCGIRKKEERMGTYGEYTGRMIIPEGKKEEFAKWVVKLLNYGGMMQFEQISMYGHDMALLKPLELYPGGKVEFYFNYFEDDVWEDAGFNADTGYFYSNKIGGAEFNDVVTAVHFLYEVCDEDYGFADINGSVVNESRYVGWINHMLGTNFSMKKRYSLWDNAERFALERVEDYEEPLTVDDVMDFIPLEGRYAAGGIEFSDLMYITDGTKTLTIDEIVPGTYPDDIYQCKKALEVFFEKEKNEKAVDKVWELIKLDRDARKNIQDTDLADIAEMSLILPARVIVYLTAELKELRFWEFWKDIRKFVYHDCIMKKYVSDELEQKRRKAIEMPVAPVRTSEFLCQDGYFAFYNTPKELKGKPNYYISDDDRLYWWDGSDEVRISEHMDKWLKELAQQHKELQAKLSGEEGKQNDFLSVFLSLLVEIDSYYKRIYPFQSMFYEFLQNSGRDEYQAALELLRKISDDNKENGKIIEKASIDWSITSRNVTQNIGRLKLKRYLSVMANKDLRKKYFGF